MSTNRMYGSEFIFSDRSRTNNIVLKPGAGETLTIEGLSVAGSSLGAGKILVGNSEGTSTETTMSGDATISMTGVVTLSNSGITTGTYVAPTIAVNSKGQITTASSGITSGNNTHVMFNDSGSIGDDSALSYNKSTHTFSCSNLVNSSVISNTGGSNSTPCYSFTSDLDTGMYSSSANTIDFTTGGTKRLTINSSTVTSSLPIVAPSGSVTSPGISFSASTGFYSPSSDFISCATGGSKKLEIGTGASVGALVSIGKDANSVCSSGGTGACLRIEGSSYSDSGTNQGRAPLEISSSQPYALSTIPCYINFANSSGSVIGSLAQSSLFGIALALTSDYRLKENVEDIEDGLSKINSLDPVAFNWKGHEGGTEVPQEQTEFGFIAHEFQETFPESVIGTKDAVDQSGNPIYQKMNNAVLIPYTIAAIKELDAKLEKLRTRVEEIAALRPMGHEDFMELVALKDKLKVNNAG